MNGTRILRLLGAALCLALPVQVHAAWTFAEGEWDTASWIMTFVEQTGSTSASATRLTFGFFTQNSISLTQIAGYDNLRLTITPVPEPETWAMLLAGLGLLGLGARPLRR